MYWGYRDQWDEGGTSEGSCFMWVCVCVWANKFMMMRLEYVEEYDLCKNE